MRLSKLHINGFKSFPDRAELGFDEGVTAIVGPNGCGKSNVVDAITWVLGEQSAKSLRGERMEDVIFNGSEARKPTATAEVRLKLSDVALTAMPAVATTDEFLDEAPLITRNVEIGRRLYRSGESEYLIDGEVCRLRDIHDLLMDSGVGVKGYAVIEQGKIGQILSSRPAERRTLIEEAAGVTKYKSRRRSAELKLEAAKQNLTRVDDIVFEVEKQRGALKRQAARARRYKRLRDELRRWEQVQFARRHVMLSEEIAAADEKLADARAREAAAAARVAELETRLDQIREALTGAEATAAEAREAAHTRELEIGRRQQQIQFDRQQIEELDRRHGTLSAEAAELVERRLPAERAIEAQREALARARQALEGAAGRVDACEAEYRQALAVVQTAEREADQTRAAVMSASTTVSALRQARDNAADARDRVAAQRSRLDVEARDLEHESERARGERDQASAALASARELLATATNERRELEEHLTKRRGERDQAADRLKGLQRDLARLEARLRSLEELDSRRATFADAARYLLAEAPASVRQHGAVADHLDVDRPYARAVDALFGDLLQHVLVETHEDVAQAFALLAEANSGRCGFVVLQRDNDTEGLAQSTRLAGTVLDSAAVAPVDLNSVVRAVGPYADRLEPLLRSAWIVETFEAARVLSARSGDPVATLAGEVFRGGVLVEGGGRQDARGILEMRGDIDRLRDEVSVLSADVHRLTDDLSEIEVTIGAAQAALAVRVGDQHTQEKLIVGFEGQIRRGDEEVNRVGRRLQVVETERRRAGDEEQTAEKRREDAVAAMAEHEVQQREAESRLSDVIARLQAARGESESKMRLVTDARTEQATLNERAAGLETEVAHLEQSARDLEDRIVARQQELERTGARVVELRTSVAESESVLERDLRMLDDLRQQVREADVAAAAERAEFGQYEQGIRGARHSLEAVRTDVTQFEVARATAASDLGHLETACIDTVGSTIEEVAIEVARMERDGELVAPAKRLAAIAVADDEDDSEGASSVVVEEPSEAEEASVAARADEQVDPDAVIGDLRLKIERLGPVNMMAIEQFDELEARHTFLTSQRTDLLDSIAQTGEAIKKIDKTTRERFEEAFASINANFEQTFTTLFGGGRAGLLLIDQENDPESGIDIIAQPPGKRLQNVQLLSGGEKALTAMALMFGIFKYRPSPFCLLDEIDAPLDDANIGRFVEMLQGMQSHTQFILITHHRKTMEIANRLYGVTMEEPGVSKLISLQLN